MSSRALWGWSPPALPADTGLKRLVDRWLPATGLGLCLFWAFVVGLLLAAPHLPRRGDLALDGVAALVSASWCALNFWRCRHAHCLVTSSGWFGLAGFAFAEAALGRTLIAGYEQPVFLAILAAGIGFEWAWSRTHGTNAVGGCVPRGGSALS